MAGKRRYLKSSTSPGKVLFENYFSLKPPDPRDLAARCGSTVSASTPSAWARLGAITGIPTGYQTKARALFAGLVALAKYTAEPVRVIVQLASVWEAWHQQHKGQPFQDLLEDIARKTNRGSQSCTSHATPKHQTRLAMNRSCDGDKGMQPLCPHVHREICKCGGGVKKFIPRCTCLV